MEFTINKSDIEWLNITIEDKTKLLNFLARFDQWDKYEIKWENIWNLIYLFFVINSKIPITEFKLEEQKKIEETFWTAKNSEHNEEEDKDEDKDKDKDEDENIAKEKVPALPKVPFRAAIDDLDIRRLREAVAALGLDMAQQNVALDEIRFIYRRLDGWNRTTPDWC